PDGLAWGRHVVVVGDDEAADPPQKIRTPPPRFSGGPGDDDVFGPVPIGDGEALRSLQPPALPSRRHWRRAALYRRALLAALDPRLAVLGTAAAVLLAASTAVFHSTPHLYPTAGQPTATSWLDALVFTATTAYGNTDLSHAVWWAKLYAVLF